MQIEISDEDAKVLSVGVEMLCEMYKHAKEHLLGCPSVDSPEMLTDVAADYDGNLAALQRIELALGSASV